jgi:hypothetical protein
MSLATLTLCTAYQFVFIFVSVKYNPQFSTGCFKKHHTLSFAANSGKEHQKCMKCSKQLLLTMPWREHRLVMGFLFSNMVELWFKVVNFR